MMMKESQHRRSSSSLAAAAAAAAAVSEHCHEENENDHVAVPPPSSVSHLVVTTIRQTNDKVLVGAPPPYAMRMMMMNRHYDDDYKELRRRDTFVRHRVRGGRMVGCCQQRRRTEEHRRRRYYRKFQTTASFAVRVPRIWWLWQVVVLVCWSSQWVVPVQVVFGEDVVGSIFNVEDVDGDVELQEPIVLLDSTTVSATNPTTTKTTEEEVSPTTTNKSRPKRNHSANNIVHDWWLKLQQQVTHMSSSSSSSSRMSNHNSKNKKTSTENSPLPQQQQQHHVLTAAQQEWMQQLLQDHPSTTIVDPATTTTTTTTTTEQQLQLQQQQQLQIQLQQRHAIAIKGQERRRGLFQYTIQQHYATSYLHNVGTASASTPTVDADNKYEMIRQQQQRLYNQTLWNRASQAFHAFTHTTNPFNTDVGAINPGQRPSTTTTTTTTNDSGSGTGTRKIDRTSFLYDGLPPFPPSRSVHNRQLIRDMFQHGYDAYMYQAFPEYGEICPISCTPCTFDLIKLPALTLIDSLDTLLVLNNVTEFARSVERLRFVHTTTATMASSLFATDQNVSVFETNIRVLGGLLSAHQLALAMKLDVVSTRTDDTTILFGDIFDAVTTTTAADDDDNGDETDIRQPTVRYGHFDQTIDPVERWMEYKTIVNPRDMLGSMQLGDALMNDVDESRPELDGCDASFDTSTTSLSSSSSIYLDQLATMSPCDSSSASLLMTSPKNPFVTSPYPLHLVSSSVVASNEANTCSTKNTTTTSTATKTTTATTKKISSTVHIPGSDIWTYDGFLLELALDIGNRLLPAFSTPTGIPYGTVNLLYGVPNGETTVASLAGGGTLTMEMELLSRLTGDVRFGKAAKLASRALFRYRSTLNLFGKHIDIRSGTWVETLSGIGSNSDSFLEYLAKHYMLFPEDDDFWIMFKVAYAGVHNESRLGEWYADVDMNYGTSSGQSRRVFESLAAFYPGLQVLLGEIAPAARTLNSMFMVREILGFLPERFNYGVWNLDHNRDGAGIHPLRPELLESNYLMHRATKSIRTGQSHHANDDDQTTMDDQVSGWQWAADYALHKLATVTQAQCGFAGIRELKPQTTGSIDNRNTAGIAYIDEMPSFFLSETLKYLYLTFDDDNILHQDTDHQWIFTTEAHPVHYVPYKSTTSNATVLARRELTRDIKAVAAILRRRLQQHSNGNTQNVTHSKYDNSFFRGKWTKVINSVSYRDDIISAISQRSFHRQNATTKTIFNDHASQFVPFGQFEQDAFRESGRKINTANIALGNSGSGIRIQKNCPNIDRSDLLWMHALSGGAIDYSDTYVSTGYDTLIEEPHYFTTFGAADAIGSLGIGLYIGEKDIEGDLCPISTAKAEVAAVLVDENSESNTSTTIASDVGNFEISTYPGGTGFQVRHIENGEVIKATVVTGDSHPIAIIHSELCTKNWILLPKTGSDDGGFEVVREKRRRSSLADFEGNSFTCEVKLIKVNVDDEDSDANQETILTSIPCTPAAFGPTQLSLLMEQGAISVDAKLHRPTPENLWGCNVPTSSTPLEDALTAFQVSERIEIDVEGDEIVVNGDNTQSWAGNSIHMVHRGECNFFSKAVNTYKTWNVDALIVINSSDDMFMMSSSLEDEENIDPIEVPISVLISEQDGTTLLDKINNDNALQSASFFARIEVLQSVKLDDHGEIEASQINWPLVRGAANVLEIMAEFGWGVHAVHKTESRYQEWQLNILKHSIDKQG